MRIKMRVRASLFALAVAIAVVGCNGGGPGGAPFFVVETTYQSNGITNVDPHVNVGGAVNGDPGLFCTQYNSGNSSFSGTTDQNGLFKVANADVGPSCSWTINRGSSAGCPNPNPSGTTAIVSTSGVTVNVPCNAATVFNSSPRYVNSTNPPTSVTIAGRNMTSTYGMPQAKVYDVNQSLLLTVAASGAAGDGTSITLPASGIASLGDGDYGAVVYVKQSNGTWQPVGGAGLSVYTPDPGPPGGGCHPPSPCTQ